MAFLAKLRPMGPWRAGPDSGERSRASGMLHSDALYSALTHAMLQLGLLEPWIRATAANPQGSAVRFSSCFPFIDQFLLVAPPRTLWPLAASRKVRWKSAKFVPTSMVSLLLNGRTVREDDWVVDGASECLLPVFRGQIVSSPFRPALRSAAAVDRMGEGVEPHRTACVEFHKDAGIWIAFDFADDSARECWTPALQGALRLLADTGLGGERSRGWGRFEQPEFQEGPLARLLFGKHAPAPAAAASANSYWLLSLFSPSESDAVDWQQGSYAAAMRSGRVDSPSGSGEVKKTSRVIVEGSVLVSAAPLQGVARDVAPEGFAHPVYRAGFALALPVPAKKSEPVLVEEAETPTSTEQDAEDAQASPANPESGEVAALALPPVEPVVEEAILETSEEAVEPDEVHVAEDASVAPVEAHVAEEASGQPTTSDLEAPASTSEATAATPIELHPATEPQEKKESAE